MRFDNIWARLFALSSDLALGMTKDPRGAPTGAMRSKGLLSDLLNVTLLDEFLPGEQTIVMKMMGGLEMVLKMGKSSITASFLHRQRITLQRKISKQKAARIVL